MSSVKKGKEKKKNVLPSIFTLGKNVKKKKESVEEETKSAFAMIVRNVNFLDENNTRKSE